tara:strand:+ start:722 stop:1672 length:951 start_codon:yes stop_codon:yes gene_type:complete
MSYIIDNHNQNSKLLHINSEDATNNLSTIAKESYFQFFIGSQIKCNNNERMLISLHSATIPYSFYNIRDNINDTIPYLIDDTYSTNQFITIPKGNYTASSLKTLIGSLLSAQADITSTISLSFDRTTMKFKYINSSNLQNLKLDFSKRNDTAYIESGFSTNEQSGSIDMDGLESSNVIDVNGSIHSLFLRTNLSQLGSIDSNSGGFNTILGKIPITSNFGGVLFFKPNNNTHKILNQNNNINFLTVRLTDEKNRLVDLNGLNFSLSIQIDFIYYKPEVVETTPVRYLPNIKDLREIDPKLKRHEVKQEDKKRYLKN